MENARRVREGLAASGFTVFAGEHAPYIWMRTPDGLSSWDFFDRLLNEAHVVGTPQGYFFQPDKNDGEVELENKVSVGILSQMVGFRTKPGHGVAGMVWQSGQPLVVTDYDAWAHRSADFPGIHVKRDTS